jgi:hypothetical protein
MKRIGLKNFRRFVRQLGQGMTEYIIIVAVIGIASIAIYVLYGDVLRNQTAAAGVALSGHGGEAQMSSASNTAIAAGMDAGTGRDMKNFAENPDPHQ